MSEVPERIWAAISSRHGWRTTDRKPVEDVIDICGYKEYIREDIHEARIKDLEAALSWYEQTVREFATATDQRADQAELALDSDRGKTARDTLAKQGE